MGAKKQAEEQAWGVILDFFKGIREVEWKNIIGNFLMILGLNIFTFGFTVKALIPATVVGIIAFGYELHTGKKKEEAKLFVEKYYEDLRKEKERVFQKEYGVKYTPVNVFLIYHIFKILRIFKFFIIKF